MADEPITPPAADDKPATDDKPTDDKAATFDAKYVEGLRQESAKHRVAAKSLKDEIDGLKSSLAKALGVGDDKADPAKLQEAITAKDAELRQLKVEGKVRGLAAKLSADADALLDSRSFVSSLADLDPSAATFEADLSVAMAAAIASNARLKIGGQAPPRGGTEINGGNTVKTTFSREQLRDPAFYAENEKEILAAYREGRITQ
jgi:hypothetical protein